MVNKMMPKSKWGLVEFILVQGFILIISHRAANILIITDMVTLSDDFHPVMYSVSSLVEVLSPRMTQRIYQAEIIITLTTLWDYFWEFYTHSLIYDPNRPLIELRNVCFTAVIVIQVYWQVLIFPFNNRLSYTSLPLQKTEFDILYMNSSFAKT